MFRVYTNPEASGDPTYFDFLTEALTSLQKNYSIVFSESFFSTQPVPVDQYNISAYLNGNGLTFALGPSASLFRLAGYGSSSVYTANVSSRVYANDSSTTIFGNDNRDILHGGAGDDRFFGGLGNDVLYGGGGSDFIFMGAGRDRAYGDIGNDVLLGGGDRNQFTGGAGADVFIVSYAQNSVNHIWDYSAGDSDRVVFSGFAGVEDYDSLLEMAKISQASDGVVIRLGDSVTRLIGVEMPTLSAEMFEFDLDLHMPAFVEFSEFMTSDLSEKLDQIDIDGVTYFRRDSEPPHLDYKYQDAGGSWWSPDYFVVVVAGQSNMLGSGSGGDMSLDPNVFAYDYVHDTVIAADYAAPPSGGEGVRTGTSLRNNLYYPFANEMSAELMRPVLVVAHPVSGSRIDTWLETGTATNWNYLSGDVARALEQVGQNSVDAFLWHQGEGDYPVATEDYSASVLELVDQVRSQVWGAEELPFLIGELSREGVNSAQNLALQLLEIANTDPNLAFVSSAGLVSFDEPGVHFDGVSLVEFGQRYADELIDILAGVTDPETNIAPVANDQVPFPATLTVAEGQELRLDLSEYFYDPDGDELYYYTSLDDRRQYFARCDQDTNELVLKPGYDSAGDYMVKLYANDYDLDGECLFLSLSVQQAAPLITAYTGRDFLVEYDQFRDFEAAQAVLTQNRGVDILDMAAIDADEPNLITLDSLHIRGAEGMNGLFQLDEHVLRGYFYGEAEFDVTANALNNYMVGSVASNSMWGAGGDDRLYGQDGADHLFGEGGNDSIYGDLGDDVLSGGAGNDNAWGGAGADLFLFEFGDEYLYARDFNLAEEDRIQLSGFNSFEDYDSFVGSASCFNSGSRLIVDIEGDRILIENMSVENMQGSMFLFA